jgi:hypothetical protein
VQISQFGKFAPGLTLSVNRSQMGAESGLPLSDRTWTNRQILPISADFCQIGQFVQFADLTKSVTVTDFSL